MDTTDKFKETIKAYLDKQAEEDELFAPVYANEKKNIDECVQYILNTVKEIGKAGFADSEIYSMAIHYYEEENIDPGKEIKDMQIIVNHEVKLTEEEIEDARKQAKERIISEALREMKSKKTSSAKKDTTPESSQASLF